MRRWWIYVDTSVFGGCFDPEFAEWLNALMDDFRSDRFVPVVSDVTSGEVAMAPEPVRDLFSGLPESVENPPASEEASTSNTATDR
jgi:hypothetical protein